MKPYIGITGFMTPQEVRTLLGQMSHNENAPQLMVGVLASSKTLAGLPNKWPGRFPKVERIAEVFQDDSRCFNLIHYSTNDQTDLITQLFQVNAFGGSALNGFQLNIPWPDPDILRRYRALNPKHQLVLQLGTHAFEVVGSSVARLAQRVSLYKDTVEGVLIDPSGGKGEPADWSKVRECVKEIKNQGLDLGVGIAGGLSAPRLRAIAPILEEFGEINIDAEGRLRNPETDDLDIWRACEYLHSALDMYESYRKGDRPLRFNAPATASCST